MKFNFSLYLGSIDKWYRFYPMTTKTHLDIIKILLNGDNDVILLTIKEFIIEQCIDSKAISDDFEHISILDIWLIMLNLRSVSLGNIIDLEIKCKDTDKKFNYELDINSIESNILNIDQQSFLNKHINEHGISIMYSIPSIFSNIEYNKKTKIDELQHMIVKSIKHVSINNEIIDIQSMRDGDIVSIYDAFPSKIANKIYKNIADLETLLNTIKVYEIFSPYTNRVSISQYLTIRREFTIDLFRLLFDESLMNMLDLIFAISKHSGLNLTDIHNMVPMDRMFLEHKIEEEIKANESKQKQSNSPTACQSPMIEDGTNAFL